MSTSKDPVYHCYEANGSLTLSRDWVDTSAVPDDHPWRDLAVAVLVEYRLGVIGSQRAMDDLCRYLLQRDMLKEREDRVIR